MTVVEIDEIVDLSPMQWFMMLEEPELLPKVQKACKAVRVQRTWGKTVAQYDAVVGPIAATVETVQTYQIHENGDIEIQSSSSGPFKYARARWILSAVPNQPGQTHIVFTFDYEFSKAIYSLIGNPILARMSKHLLPAIYKQIKPIYEHEAALLSKASPQ